MLHLSSIADAYEVSCTESEYNHKTVRLIQGIDLERAPEKREEEIVDIAPGQRQGRVQVTRPGSYGNVKSCKPPLTSRGLQISLVHATMASRLLQSTDDSFDVGRHK